MPQVLKMLLHWAVFQLLTESQELCVKTYGEKHMLMLRLLINIGILYENNQDYQRAYDQFVKWHKACFEV